MVSKKKNNTFWLHFDIRFVVLMSLTVLFTFSFGIMNMNAQSMSSDTIHLFGHNNFTNQIILISCSIGLLLTLIFLILLRILRNNVTNTKKKLRDQNRRLALAIHAGDIKVFRYDVEKNMFYNVQWDNIPAGGRSMKEELETIHPADQQVFLDTFDRLIHGEDYHKRICMRIHVDKYKEWRIIEKEFSTLKDDNGKVVTILGSRSDITERQKMHVQLQESVSKMQCAIASSNLTLWEL